MSNWYEDDGSIYFGDGTWIRLENKIKAQQIVAKFSATVDALATELEAVKAELARVKAESLRVVKVGDPCEISKISICACFLHLGVLYRLYSFSHEEFGAWQISDHTEHLFSPDTIVQRVELKPWESSNEAD